MPYYPFPIWLCSETIIASQFWSETIAVIHLLLDFSWKAILIVLQGYDCSCILHENRVNHGFLIQILVSMHFENWVNHGFLIQILVHAFWKLGQPWYPYPEIPELLQQYECALLGETHDILQRNKSIFSDIWVKPDCW